MNNSIKTYRGNGGIIIEIYDAERERRCTATMDGDLAVKIAAGLLHAVFYAD